MDDYLRTVGDYVNTTINAGFRIEGVHEIAVPESAKAENPQLHERYARSGVARVAVKARKVE